MSYASVAALSEDSDFASRTQACYAIETESDPMRENPGLWQGQNAWAMAAKPGFGDAYASALASGVTRPGLDPSVISDNQILAAVQSLMAESMAESA